MERKQILQYALMGIDRKREEILAELSAMNSPKRQTIQTVEKPKRVVSPEARRHMSIGQKSRWEAKRRVSNRTRSSVGRAAAS